jgi:predicted small secreted protein
MRAAAVVMALSCALAGCAEWRTAGREIGATGKEVGKSAAEVGKEIGRGARDVAKDLGRATAEAAREVREDLKDEDD